VKNSLETKKRKEKKKTKETNINRFNDLECKQNPVPDYEKPEADSNSASQQTKYNRMRVGAEDREGVENTVGKNLVGGVPEYEINKQLATRAANA